jgi:NodT family efflux transporter outer membrane factor (OMF) lipoprotein
MKTASVLPLSLGVLLLGACASTPPPLPTVTSSAYAPEGDRQVLPEASGEAQKLGAKATVAAKWWLAFGSPKIDTLVDKALAANPSLKAQDATLAAARQSYAAQASTLWPQASAGYNLQRAENSNSLSTPLGISNPPSLYSLHTAQVDVSYTADIWGAGREGLKAAKYQTQGIAFQAEAARQALIANVVSAAIQAAALSDQVKVAGRAADDSEKLLAYAQKQKALGNMGDADVANVVNLVANDRQTEIGLRHALFVQLRLIGTLTGQESAAPVDVPASLADIALPADLPMVLPVDIVNIRPDIRYAAAQFDAAAASVHAAKAARLPVISLDGSAGGASTQLASLFNNGNSFWSLGVGIAEPLTGAVGLYHQQKAAEAQLLAAQAQYQSTVQSALGGIADTLDALYADARAADAADKQAQATAGLLEDQTRQTKLGQSGDVDLLAADRAAAQALASQSLARSQRYADTVALFLAMGS